MKRMHIAVLGVQETRAKKTEIRIEDEFVVASSAANERGVVVVSCGFT